MRTTCTDSTADDSPLPTTGNSTANATNPTTKTRRRNPPTSSPSTTKAEKMNNAENHATIEIKRKAAREDSRYELMERGEKRNFEKPDKPDDNTSGLMEKNVADSLSSLPPEDLRNVGILALLCTFFFPLVSELGLMIRFVAGDSCWIGVWERSVFVEGQGIVWTGGRV